jgi:catechol 2,3-dioxygenase-like lactoylglutathione lyase family enzyme
MSTPVLPRVDHITLTVKDFDQSKKFYTQLFVDFLGAKVLLDEDRVFGVQFESGFLFEICPENEEFETSKFNRYQVGLHHFALELESKEKIDEVYQKLLDLKVKILDAPTFYPEYVEGYYAVYWQDLNGFKMEFMCYDKAQSKIN